MGARGYTLLRCDAKDADRLKVGFPVQTPGFIISPASGEIRLPSQTIPLWIAGCRVELCL
jgi:hypothetical protein